MSSQPSALSSNRNSLKPCLVVVPLQRTELELRTSAAHALETLDGQTILPSKDVKVFDSDGKRLGKPALTQQRETDNSSGVNMIGSATRAWHIKPPENCRSKAAGIDIPRDN